MMSDAELATTQAGLGIKDRLGALTLGLPTTRVDIKQSSTTFSGTSTASSSFFADFMAR
ncbi:MAG: hypothetical protein HC848_10140 [Limnobacter sp.]|nr:hypothetical protein [Limnobacter sp.]